MNVRPSVYKPDKCAWNLFEFSDTTTFFTACDLCVPLKDTSIVHTLICFKLVAW